MTHHGWLKPYVPERPAADIEAEIERLHRQLAEMANGEASARELWVVVERIRDLRAQL